jgi:plastocyanin
MRLSALATTALLLALTPLVALFGQATPALAKEAQVAIVSIVQGYRPGTVTVGSGETVTWTNEDDGNLHNAICDASCPETFSSGPSAPKGSVGSHRFVKEGTYRYHCELHPNMVGFVVVTAAVPTTTTAPGTATTTTSPHATTSSSTTSTTAPVVLTTEPTTTTVVPVIVPARRASTSTDKNDSRKIALGVSGLLVLTALASFVATRVSDRQGR